MDFDPFPSNLPVLNGQDPFGNGNAAGAALWPIMSGAQFDAVVCRECTTTLADVNESLPFVQDSVPLPLYGLALWQYGVGSGTGNKGLRALATVDAVPQMQGAFTANNAYNVANVTGTIHDYLTGWQALQPGGTVDVPNNTVTPWQRAYRPVSSRFLAAELVNGQPVVYNVQPYALLEARFRGGRSYCASREAARAQDAAHNSIPSADLYSMGADSTTTFAFWTLDNSASSVRVADPQEYRDSNGANAFVIPIQISNTLAPIKGPLTPDIDEIAMPVVWLTGDSEVESIEAQNTKAYINAQHFDYFEGQHVKGDVKATDLSIFNVGLVQFVGGFRVSLDYGELLAQQPTPSSTPDSTVLDGGRLLGLTNWPTARSWEADPFNGAHYRPGTTASDAPFDFHVREMPDSSLVPYFAPLEDDGRFDPWALPTGFGTYMRAANDDDRSVAIRSRVSETLDIGIKGGLDLSTGSNFQFFAGAKGDGSITMEVERIHTLREQVSAVQGTAFNGYNTVNEMLPFPYTTANLSGNPVLAQTNMVLIPESRTSNTIKPLVVSLDFTLHVDLPFIPTIDVQWSQPLYDSGSIGLNGDTTIGSEDKRLRIGEFSDWGMEFNAPPNNFRSVYSHLPQPGASDPSKFASFPYSTTPPNGGEPPLDACFNDPTHLGTPPETHKGGPGTQVAPNQCVYGLACLPVPNEATGKGTCTQPLKVPDHVCDPGFANYYQSWIPTVPQLAGADAQQCALAEFAFLCSGMWQEQAWGNVGEVVAHIADPTDPTVIATTQDILTKCLTAFIPAGTDQASANDQAKNLAATLFGWGLCDDTAKLLGAAP